MTGCATIPAARAAIWAKDIGLTPNGRSLYLLSDYVIAHFRRDWDSGGLTFGGCIGPAASGCRDLGLGSTLYGAVSVSALEDSVYASTTSSLAHFRRDRRSGDLSYVGCVSSVERACARPPVSLSGVKGLAARHGMSVYATTSTATGGIVRFERHANGDIGFAQCIGDNVPGCEGIGGAASNALNHPAAVAESPDGKSVYLVSADPGAIAHFRVDPETLNLRFAGCIGQSTRGPTGRQIGPGCRTLEPSVVLRDATSLVVTGDGGSVYVSSRAQGGTVSHFRRDPASGDLSFAGCLNVNGVGCRAVGAAGVLVGGGSVDASPDGTAVYVGAPAPGTVAHFRRAPDGGLAYAGCIGEGGTACTTAGTPVAGLSRVVVSPEGRSLYALARDRAAAERATVTRFERGTVPPAALRVAQVSVPDGTIWGGRVQDVALDPSTAADVPRRRFLALSDAAGLWESADNAASWRRLSDLDRFGQFRLRSVAFDPSARGRGTVYVSAGGDRQTPTQAGVYKSLDGGRVWRRLSNSLAPCPDADPAQLAVNAAGSRLYVVQGCAVGYSDDGGERFRWEQPGPAGGDYRGVAVGSDGTAFVCGLKGLFRHESDGTWTAIGNPPGAGDAASCAVGVMPGSRATAFVAALWGGLGMVDVYEADAGASGWTFSRLRGDPRNLTNRPLVVQTRARAGGDFDLYYSNGVGFDFLRCRTTGAPPYCPVGAQSFLGTPLNPSYWLHVGWTGTGLAVHADPSRAIFDPTDPARCLALLANDGGFERPAPGDCDGTGATGWTRLNRGYAAQQLYELARTWRWDGSVDLYASLQDNGFQAYSSADGVWRQAWGSDGFYTAVDPIQTLPPVSLLATDNLGSQVARRFYADASTFTLPPAPPAVGPVYAAASFRNRGFAVGTYGNQRTQALTTIDDGRTWALLGSAIPDAPGVPSSPMLLRATGTPDSPIFHLRTIGQLVRIDGLGPAARVTNLSAGTSGFGAFGVSYLDWAKLYAYDCNGASNCPGGRFVKKTAPDGAWVEDPVLRRMTQSDWNGNAYMYTPGYPDDAEASTFEFDPSDDRIVVLGTKHVGVLVSVDGGASWGRLPAAIPDVRSVAFSPRRGHFFVGTFGLGVHEVWLSASSLNLSPSGRVSARLTDINGAPLAARPVTFQRTDASGTPLLEEAAMTDAGGVAAPSAAFQASTAGEHVWARFDGDRRSGAVTLVGSLTRR